MHSSKNLCTIYIFIFIFSKKIIWNRFYTTHYIRLVRNEECNRIKFVSIHSCADSGGHSNVAIDPLRLILFYVKEYFLHILLNTYDWYVSNVIFCETWIKDFGILSLILLSKTVICCISNGNTIFRILWQQEISFYHVFFFCRYYIDLFLLVHFVGISPLKYKPT